MSNIPTMPGREPRQATDADDAVLDPAASPVLRALRVGSSPFSWWRMLPADAFRAADHLRIGGALDELASAFATGRSVPALKGDPDAAIALGRIFPADSAIDGLVRINQLGASIWEVAHDWLGLWCLALAYFALAVISALVVKRGQGHAQG